MITEREKKLIEWLDKRIKNSSGDSAVDKMNHSAFSLVKHKLEKTGWKNTFAYLKDNHAKYSVSSMKGSRMLGHACKEVLQKIYSIEEAMKHG